MTPHDSTTLTPDEKDAIRFRYARVCLSVPRERAYQVVADEFEVSEATVRLLTFPGAQRELNTDV